MCNLRMFSKSLLFFNTALSVFRDNPNDEDNLGFSGYTAQQSVEFALKAFLGFTDVEIPKKHSIAKLIEITDNSKSKCIITGWIRDNADKLTTWEAEGRYNCNKFFTMLQIKDALINIKEFLVINGITPKLLPEVTNEVKEQLCITIPLNDLPEKDLEWNILYKIFLWEMPTKEKILFQLDMYFAEFKITDKEAEIARLKSCYKTEDMRVIKKRAEELYTKSIALKGLPE